MASSKVDSSMTASKVDSTMMSSKVDSSMAQLLASVLGKCPAGEVLMMMMHKAQQRKGTGRNRRPSQLTAYKSVCSTSFTSVKVSGVEAVTDILCQGLRVMCR
jgi:hypothetical protein